ncbi:MAG: glycosyltransferase [Kiritimatiellia bacterium]|jgi:glycosyltransferase involved in cell wall biosynthesis
MVQVAIVIPSLDPDKRLPRYCRDLRAITSAPILLVDDGSKPELRPIFDECAAAGPDISFVRHGTNRGKGRALKTAFAHLLETRPDGIGCITADSDGQHSPADVARCLEHFQANPDALVLGVRDFSQSHVPLKSRFGNKGMLLFFRVATGRSFLDTQTGLRAIPAEMMRSLLSVPGERFEFETRMLLALHDRPLLQIPIETIYEEGNKGTHFNPFSDSMKICGILVKALARRFGLFVLASALSFVVDILLFRFLYYGVFDEEGRAHLFLSVVLARVVSGTFNYLVNRFLVFAESRKRHVFGHYSAHKYAVLALAIVTASYLGTKILHAGFPGVSLTWIKAIVDLFLFLASFAIQRMVIFRHKAG